MLSEVFHADPQALDIWTGKWRWIPETAHFSDPLHANGWQEQIMDVVVKDGTLYQLNNQILADGSRTAWEHKGAFDGKPRGNYRLATDQPDVIIAYHQLSDRVFADSYYAQNGSFRGTEHVVVEDDKLSVFGCITIDTTQYPYFEEWVRME